MFNFCQVDLKLRNGHQMNNGWWLLIQDELELMSWYAKANGFAKAWYDLKMNHKHSHYKTMEAFLLELKCHNHTNKKTFSNLDLAELYNEIKYDTKSKMLSEHGSILINRAGGFCIPSESVIIKQSVKNDELIFPDSGVKEIKIEKFPGGTHFYVSINSVPVIYKGYEKWDTREEAEKAANEYLKTFKPVTKEDDFND